MIYNESAQAQNQNFSGSDRHWAGFYSRLHLHVGHDMFFNGGLGKSLCIFPRDLEIVNYRVTSELEPG
ncbi:hypothetical protein EYC84_006912 [Monilinia fructicola]|uniref:Uncharacterized protein n=1 Tax=Monilinia fructicola TaxID=38448 RepID=A0A5M9K4X1_MONFR|nr:hypothetical protein EYC84_006912 [Monilinia fructicola]